MFKSVLSGVVFFLLVNIVGSSVNSEEKYPSGFDFRNYENSRKITETNQIKKLKQEILADVGVGSKRRERTGKIVAYIEGSFAGKGIKEKLAVFEYASSLGRNEQPIPSEQTGNTIAYLFSNHSQSWEFKLENTGSYHVSSSQVNFGNYIKNVGDLNGDGRDEILQIYEYKTKFGIAYYNAYMINLVPNLGKAIGKLGYYQVVYAEMPNVYTNNCNSNGEIKKIVAKNVTFKKDKLVLDTYEASCGLNLKMSQYKFISSEAVLVKKISVRW
jgi:hypothetical protein